MNVETLAKTACGLLVVLFFATVLSLIVWFMGSSNPAVPAGYVAYQTQGSWFGQSRFYGTLKGPSSPGMTWLLRSFEVSITPYSYSEDFGGDSDVLSKDNLKISYNVNIIWRVKEDGVKELVEKYATIDPTGKQDPEKIVRVAYDNYLKQPFKTYCRAEVQKLNWEEIKNQQVAIGETIKAKMEHLAKDTPFDIIDVAVGNIQYPKVVSDAVADNLASTQRIEKEKKSAEIRIIQSEGIAKAMEIINSKLTNQYLQHEAIEAQKTIISGPNHSVIYIPTGNMGVPLISTVQKAEGDK